MGKLCAHKCVGNVLRNLDLGNIKIYLGENTLILLYEYNYLLSTPSVDKPPDLIGLGGLSTL